MTFFGAVGVGVKKPMGVVTPIGVVEPIEHFSGWLKPLSGGARPRSSAAESAGHVHRFFFFRFWLPARYIV